MRGIAQGANQGNHIQAELTVRESPCSLLFWPIGPMIPLARLIAAPAHTQGEPTAPLQGGNGSAFVRYATGIGCPQPPQQVRRHVSTCSVGASARRSFLAIRPSLSTRARSCPPRHCVPLECGSSHFPAQFSKTRKGAAIPRSEWGSLDFPDQLLGAILMFRDFQAGCPPFHLYPFARALARPARARRDRSPTGKCSGCERTHWWGHTAA